jgi:hypothetical protein
MCRWCWGVLATGEGTRAMTVAVECCAMSAKPPLETVEGVSRTVSIVLRCPIRGFVVGVETKTASTNKGCAVDLFLFLFYYLHPQLYDI